MYNSSNKVSKAEHSVEKFPKTKRIEWIDIAKGIGIILVSFGHLRNGDGQSVWLPALNGLITAIYFFHMPLFFFLGGLTLNTKKNFKAFIIRKAQTLLVPYYVFSLYFLAKPFAILLIPGLRKTFQTNHNYGIAHQFYDVLINGNGLWFLMAFFVGEIISYCIVKALNKTIPVFCVGLSLIVILTFLRISTPSFTLPFQLLKGAEVAGYMLVGFVLKEYLIRVSEKWQSIVIASVLLVLFCVFSVILTTDSTNNLQKQLLMLLLAALTGLFASIFLSIGINKNNILSAIGKNSLVFYALNALVLNIIKFLFFRLLKLQVTSSSFVMQFMIGGMITLLSLVILYTLSQVINKYLPWTIGKRAER